jgi:signal peptidase I
LSKIPKTAAATADPPEPERRRPEVRHWVADWTLNILVLVFGTATVAQPFVVPTSSMEENVLIGDHLIVDKMAYSPPGAVSKYLLPYQEVKRGDVAVFRYPVDIRQNFVKRVIAIPGDRIRIERKQLYLNGKAVQEPYKIHKTDYIDAYRDNFPSTPNTFIYEGARRMLEQHVEKDDVVVPPEHYFMMGDNRDNSLDSRYWGFVHRDNIIGKPVIIYWSYDAPTERLADGNINIHHLLDIALNFFSKTRWRRTFMRIEGYPLS